MSKIDNMIVDIATIKQLLLDLKPRIDSHSVDIRTHSKILNGGNGDGVGLCEKVRTIERRHALVATGVSIVSVGIWEIIRAKLGLK